MLAFASSQPIKKYEFTKMTLSSSLIQRDLQFVWHPCAQMKDYETFKPLEIVGANGAWIETKDGSKIIDATSSWWCKSLGHQHPRLKKALLKQVERFEHVMFAHTTHETVVALSEKLAMLTTSLNKVLYASDGSCAVEMAMKMSVHARQLTGEKKRNKFVALQNAYHGETVGALSVSDLGIYRRPYQSLLFDTYFISSLPYVLNTQEKLWIDCSAHWEKTQKELEKLAHQVTAIIIEPIIQGAGGMQLYSQDFLRHLRIFTREHNIHLIADEIMTGLGRTGKMLACEHAEIEPDFLCLSKGLTSGWLPLSTMLTTQPIYDLFYDDYSSGKSFLHSHTYSGNALAASIALEVLQVMEEEAICIKAKHLGESLYTAMQDIAHQTDKLEKVRGIGAIVAADLKGHASDRRIGFEFYQKAASFGALMRPLGNTIYWAPPLIMDEDSVDHLKTITLKTLAAL